MAVSATETIGDVADRIQKRLGVPADQFTAWRFKCACLPQLDCTDSVSLPYALLMTACKHWEPPKSFGPLACCRFVPDMSSRTEYLEEGDRVVAKFVRRSGEGQTSDGDYLGLEHPDTGPKRQKRPAPRCV